MNAIQATASALHGRTGLYVCAIYTVQPESFTFHMGSVEALCFAGSERDLIVIEDGRRFDASGVEIE